MKSKLAQHDFVHQSSQEDIFPRDLYYASTIFEPEFIVWKVLRMDLLYGNHSNNQRDCDIIRIIFILEIQAYNFGSKKI